jgi:hypothetical protein
MSIFAVVLFPNLFKLVDDFRLKKLKLDFEEMKKQAKLFYEEHEKWPSKFTDFLSVAGGGAPMSPWKMPYRMDDSYFYAQDNKGKVYKSFYRYYYLVMNDYPFSYKILPIFLQGITVDEGVNFFNAERASYNDKIVLYVLHLKEVRKINVIIEGNKSGNGYITNFNSIFEMNGDYTVKKTLNVSYDGKNLTASGVSNKHFGIVAEFPINKPFILRFKITSVSASSTIFFGILNSNVQNFLRIENYLNKEYEIEYKG